MIWKKQPVGSKLADLQNNKASKDTATQSAAGLMSASDKTKLDGIATGATAVSVVNNLNSDSTTSALSAAQGKALNNNLSALTGNTKWTDWTEITSFTNGANWNGNFYCKIGRITYLSISVKSLTANSNLNIFTLPDNYKPLFGIEFDGFGGNAYLNHAHFKINANGTVSVYSADTYATGFIAFPSA